MQKKLTKIFLKKDSRNFVPMTVLCVGLVFLISACKVDEEVVLSSNVSFVDHKSIMLDNRHGIDIAPHDRIYYLVRHAEKDTSGTNPDLTPAGYERAHELARIFRSARIDEVYSTIYMRTLMTGDSISRSKGISMKPYQPKELKQFAERVKNIEDQKRFLIIGHSNTTPALANHIHGETVLEDFDEKDYDNLIVIVQGKDKESQLHQLKFNPQHNTTTEDE